MSHGDNDFGTWRARAEAAESLVNSLRGELAEAKQGHEDQVYSINRQIVRIAGERDEARAEVEKMRGIISGLLGDNYIYEEGSSLCFFCQTGKEGQTDDDDLMSLLENPYNHAPECTWRLACAALALTPEKGDAK